MANLRFGDDMAPAAGGNGIGLIFSSHLVLTLNRLGDQNYRLHAVSDRGSNGPADRRGRDFGKSPGGDFLI